MQISRHSWTVFLTQSVSASVALVLAWLLRFDFASPPPLRVLLIAGSILVACRWAALCLYKLNHLYWRHTGIGDLTDLLKANLTGSLLFFAILRGLLSRVVFFPLSLYILEPILSFLFLAGMRVGARVVLHARASRRSGATVPVLIVGAGAAAALLLRELERMHYVAVGLVDDDPGKQNAKIGGIPVLGKVEHLARLAHRYNVQEILIAVPSASSEQMLRITNHCSRAGVPFRAVPSLGDLISGKVTIAALRPVKLDDLLGREPVRLESEGVRDRLSGRVIMVTGAAGSIGSELCKQLVNCHPQKLVCVDQAETPLFHLQQYTLAGAGVEIVYAVTDVADTEGMRQLMLQHDVRVVFHAAAYKHVPMTEANPYEGLKNNVFGLMDLVEAAEECGCEDFLLISTDKAVKPSSVMGCTKRLGEMLVGARESSGMRCVSVRFGNVLGSQGSVVTLFQEQIRSGGCITVTHPDMKRYFMTIPEAVSLVLQAFTIGEHGNILVLDMGNPVRILDLARTLIRLSGKGEDEIKIVYTGIRPGERLYEELFYDSEVPLPTPLPKVMRAQSPLPAWGTLSRRLLELQMVARDRDNEMIRAKLKQIIPEYEWEPKVPETGVFTMPRGFDPPLERESRFA